MQQAFVDSTPGSHRAALAGAALGLALAAATACADAELDGLRERFREAYYAAATGAGLTADGDDEALRAYALYPYLEARRIAKALSLTEDPEPTRHDAAAYAFLERHAGEPVTEPLERAWLESLARRGRAAALLERYRPAVATPRLQCQWLAARIDTGAIEGLAPAIIEHWLTPRQLPLECERAFEWLRAEGVLDATQTERRLRALLENGEARFARIIARGLPSERAAPWLRWADLITSPAATLDALIADPSLHVAFDALLDGFSRLATAAPDEAATRLTELVAARGLDARQTSLVRRALAYGLAWDRNPRALEHFARIAPEHVDDYTLQWWARAALWAGEWRVVAASIDAMSPDLRDAPAWSYWAARAAAMLGDGARARALYESVIADDNFYSALAAARLGRPVTPHQQRFEADDDVVDSLGRLEPMVRARELRAVDLPSEALAEWRHARRGLDEPERRQSIHLAARWGWHDVAVATATSHEIFFDYQLLYPRPFDAQVAAASRLTRLDAPLIHAVLRQESLYRADAVSTAGAIGLMQLTPATARRTAAGWDRLEPGRAVLLQPATNVELGAAHLRDLVERFDRQLPAALAAYNAGPAAVENWLPERAVEADVWIENIPYNETRTYVRRVMWHSLVFKWLEERRAQTAASWLGEIARPDGNHAGEG